MTILDGAFRRQRCLSEGVSGEIPESVGTIKLERENFQSSAYLKCIYIKTYMFFRFSSEKVGSHNKVLVCEPFEFNALGLRQV